MREDKQILHEDEKCMAFRDAGDQNKSQFLVIPKFGKGLSNISKATAEHEALLGYLMVVASKVAKKERLDKNGYKLEVNEGNTKDSKDNNSFFHIHVIGNEKLN